MLKLFCCFFLLVAMSTPALGAMLTFSAAGSDAASITPTVDAFRAALGSGRIDINWEAPGIPSDLPTPAEFFKSSSGVVFTTSGSGFQVSDDEFNSINPGYPAQFTTFSPIRLFSPLGSNVMDALFFIPGSNTPATVTGFGAVFTDVDLPDITQMVFFDKEANILGSNFVPVSPQGLSFVGGLFNAGEKIFRVRIISGNSVLGSDDDPSHGFDVVVMDNFLYSQPVSAVPLPGTLLLLGSGLAFLAAWPQRQGNYY